MKKSAAQQVTFAGGMVEGIKQDVPFEQSGGTLSSVLWLENYNHTLQQDSAIKRWGEVDSGVPYLDLGYFTPNEVYSYVINGGNTLEVDRASWLQGVQMYSVVHPEYNDNYTTFLRRYPNTTAAYSYDYIPDYIRLASVLHPVESSEAVAVVSYTIAKDGESPAWQEVWADGITDYPGWYTFGTLADVTRYGETLLFTTVLTELPYFSDSLFAYPDYANPANQYLYPVYRYLYWDITQKWKGENQFLNGIAAYDPTSIVDDKFRHWKVLPPAQYVVNNIQVGITKGILDPNGTTYNHGGTDSGNDINVCIEECSLIGYKVDQIPPTQAVTKSYAPAWLDEAYSEVFSVDDVVMKVPSDSITSLEDIDIESMNRWLHGLSMIDGKYYNTLYIPDDANWYPGHVAIPAERVRSFNVEQFGSRYQIDTMVTSGTVGTGLVYKGIVGNTLSRYTASLSPRMFMYGETFDFVLTANISGVEVLLWRGQYTVTTKPAEPVGSPQEDMVYNDSPFTVVDADSPVTIATYCQGSTSDFSREMVLLGHMSPQARYLGSYSQTNPAVFGYGYHLYHVYSNVIYFTIEVKRETMQLLIDSSCSSISLWCIKPDSNRHILKSVGTSIESPSGNIYNKPLEQGNEVVDYTKYALLKKFVIDGRTDPPTDYLNWIPSATLATNAWLERTDGTDTWYSAVPLNEVSGSTLVPNTTVPVYPTDLEVIDYLDSTSTELDTEYWTPDFVIWDYPTETTLFLNSSGKYWKGLGAKLITVIKGRTFIGGCIGADGIEEQAILRYSDVQGGAISPDIFSEERKIQVGHIPHTALLEFREQLWAFSRYQFYRIGMASITQEETWEFFDVVEQGTFNAKTAVVVPYGVCFCNEAGVWLSEGGEPQNLALAILPTYQHISSGTNYLYTTINQLDGVPYINDKGINPYLELNYDSFNDEILISSPLFTTVQNDDNDTDYLPNTDFTMIFSFKYKTWRIESSVVPNYEVEIQ